MLTCVSVAGAQGSVRVRAKVRAKVGVKVLWVLTMGYTFAY